MKKILSVSLSIFFSFCTLLVVAQSLDTDFKPYVASFGDVYAMKKLPDGKILLGGIFNGYNNVNNRGPLLRLNSDLTVDNTFNPFLGQGNFIQAIALQSDQKMIIGGMITSYDDQPVDDLLRINPDGTIDNSFTINKNNEVNIQAIALQSDGKIIVGGVIVRFNGVTRNNGHIIRLNADGSVDASFNPTVNGVVNSVVVQPSDGKIIIGGQFTEVNGSPANNLARLNVDGTTDTGFSIGTGANNEVRVVTFQNTGKLIVAGRFTQFNGEAHVFVARLNSNGSTDATFTANAGFNGAYVSDIAVQGDDRLVVGGYFTLPTRSIVRLTANGAVDATFNVGSGIEGAYSPEVKEVLLLPSDKVLAGGWFESYNGTHRSSLTYLSSTGGLETSFDLKINKPGAVYDQYIQSDGKVIIVGDFVHVNGFVYNRIARINEDGTIDPTFIIGSGFDTTPHSIGVQSSGKIIVGGEFTKYNGTASRGIVRLSNSGVYDGTFTTGSGFTGSYVGDGPRRIVVQADNKIIVGGSFTGYNGTTRGHLIRLTENGAIDNTFNAANAYTQRVQDLDYRAADGKMAIVFALYGGGVYTQVVRVIKPDGTPDSGFQEVIPNSSMGFSTAAFLPDGKLVLGGHFNSGGPNGTYNLMKVNAQGQTDNTFVYKNPVPYSWGPSNFEILNNRIVVAASTYDEHSTRNDFKVVDFNGNNVPVNMKVRGDINAIDLTGDKLYLGGRFAAVNDIRLNGIVRAIVPATLPAPTALNVSAPEKGKVLLTWTDNAFGEDGFEILRSKNGTTDYQIIGYSTVSNASYTDVTTEPEVLYYYKVRAYTLLLTSGESNEGSITTLPNVPFTPVLTQLQEVSPTSIKIKWEDKSANETEFRVYQSGQLMKVLPANTTEYIHEYLNPGESYYITVKAANTIGASGNSNNLNITLSDPITYAWSDKDMASLEERTNAVSFTIGDKAFVSTGSHASGRLKDLWQYDPVTDTWTQRADFPGTARVGAIGFAINGKGYVGLGNDGSGTFRRDMYRYDPSSNTWTALADFPADEVSGGGLSGASCFVIGDYAYVGLGNNGTNNPRTFWRYDPSTDKWEKKADFPAAGRSGGVGFALDGKGYMGMGGVSTLYKDLWRYDPVRNEWGEIWFPGPALSGAVGFGLDGRLYIGLGNDAGFPSPAHYALDFYQFNPSTGFWKDITDFNGPARSGAVSFVVGDTAYVAFGNAGATYYQDVKKLTSGTLMLPDAPDEFKATFVSSSEISLTWHDKATNETAYLVSHYETGGWVQIAALPANTTSFNHTGLTPETHHDYTVRAANYYGYSAYTDVSSATTWSDPLIPTELQAVVLSSTAIRLTWNDNSNNENTFEIQRSSDGLNFTTVRNTSANATSYLDAPLSPLTTYYYKIRAKREAGTMSAFTDVVQVTTTETPPTSPAFTSSSAVTQTTVTLNWTDLSDNETGFRLYRKKGSSSGGSFTLLTSLPANTVTYADATLDPSSQYSYGIKAYNAGGESPNDVVTTITTLANPLAPSNLKVSLPDPGKVKITWVDNSFDETGFEVHRSVNGGAFELLTKTTSNITTYVDDNLVVNIYAYKVRAYNTGLSEFSNEQSIDLNVLTDIEKTKNPLAKVYPNTAETFLVVETGDNAVVAEMHSVSGAVLIRADAAARSQTILDVSELAQGMYYLKLISKHDQQVEKIIKK